MDTREFILQVEKMIDPNEVDTIHFMQQYAKSLPISVQNAIIDQGGKKSPYMGFVVDPYSSFFAFEITNTDRATELLPDNYRLIKSRLFAHDEEKFLAIIGVFNVHTSAFWGTRLEYYIIAENIETKLLSWVIIDYDTNTLAVDNLHGLRANTTTNCTLTTDFGGNIFIDVGNSKPNRFTANIASTKRKKKALDQRLWLEGNLSVTYGKHLSNNKGRAFSLIFNPLEVEFGYDIDLSDVEIVENSWFTDMCANIGQVMIFPYAQHYLSDSPGHFSNITNQLELEQAFTQIDFTKIPKYSAVNIKRNFVIGQLVTITLIILLTIALILK